METASSAEPRVRASAVAQGTAAPAVVAGLLLGSLALVDADARAPSATQDRVPDRGSPAADPDALGPRALRALPGLGPARSLAIARSRWEEGWTGGPDAWDRVPGIGEATVRGVRAALRAPFVEAPRPAAYTLESTP